MAATVLILDGGGAFDISPISAPPLLDAADEFVHLTLDESQVVMRHPGPSLFELALGNIPVSFG